MQIDIPVQVSPPPTLQELAQDAADRYGVSFTRLWGTVLCEDGSLDPAQQSLVPDSAGPHGRENSWGLAQIDLDYHPGITKAQATDPAFSLDYLARAFSKGQTGQFHCYRKLYGTH